jgi:hypothetical protein
MEIIPNIYFKNSLLKHALFSNLKSDIITKLNAKIPELSSLRLNQELTEVVCNLIENLGPDKNKSSHQPIDKKVLVLDILTSIFSLNGAEQETIKQQIQYTYDNDLIIKIPTLKKYFGYVKSWVVKRFL